MTEGKKPTSSDVAAVCLTASERATSVDSRTHAAWRTWLAALAHDADAVMAAALAYDSLPGAGRDAWLDALDADAPSVGIPKIALFAPLLSVERDSARRARIAENVEGAATRNSPLSALVGTRDGERVCLVVSPLYLDFVEVLFCRYDQDCGVREARHVWLAHVREIDGYAREIGAELSPAPLPLVVEELAHAVVANRRSGRETPAALVQYIDLFAPDLSARCNEPRVGR
ncbi:MAG: hypothetical protein FWD69_01135 [Polyangiaceae bacterium]|nr:hypothetical protein [Polyangiaceae bacterium]